MTDTLSGIDEPSHKFPSLFQNDGSNAVRIDPVHGEFRKFSVFFIDIEQLS